jgi:hypothetical protein
MCVKNWQRDWIVTALSRTLHFVPATDYMVGARAKLRWCGAPIFGERGQRRWCDDRSSMRDMRRWRSATLAGRSRASSHSSLALRGHGAPCQLLSRVSAFTLRTGEVDTGLSTDCRTIVDRGREGR